MTSNQAKAGCHPGTCLASIRRRGRLPASPCPPGKRGQKGIGARLENAIAGWKAVCYTAGRKDGCQVGRIGARFDGGVADDVTAGVGVLADRPGHAAGAGQTGTRTSSEDRSSVALRSRPSARVDQEREYAVRPRVWLCALPRSSSKMTSHCPSAVGTAFPETGGCDQ